MAHSEFKEAPPLYGWTIAAAAGALMFGVSLVVIGIDGNGSVAIGAVVALVVGLIFTLAESKPKGASSAPVAAAPTAPAPTATAKTEAPTAPAAEASIAPATVASAPAAEAAPAEVSAPEAASEVPTEVTPEQPEGLDAPIGDRDDLKRISGVGPVLEGKLNGLGFYHFWQIAKWSRAEVEWVDSYLSFKGRIDRDDWISQASKLAEDSPSKPPA